jgi:hypothetical protein
MLKDVKDYREALARIRDYFIMTQKGKQQMKPKVTPKKRW